MAGKSRSARYYQENPEARRKKNEYQKEFNKKPSQRKKRSELVQERRRRGIYGKFDGKDVAHTSSGLKMKSAKANRGSKSDTAGDKRARGGRRKKK